MQTVAIVVVVAIFLAFQVYTLFRLSHLSKIVHQKSEHQNRSESSAHTVTRTLNRNQSPQSVRSTPLGELLEDTSRFEWPERLSCSFEVSGMDNWPECRSARVKDKPSRAANLQATKRRVYGAKLAEIRENFDSDAYF